MKPETIDKLQSHILFRMFRRYSRGMVFAMVLGMLIKAFLIETFRVPTLIMRPTLQPGDVILSAKWPFGLRLSNASTPIISGRPPQHGEIVTYTLNNSPNFTYIKRVIALSGQSVEIQDGRLVVDGSALPFNLGEDNECGEEFNQNGEYRICYSPPFLRDHPPVSVPEGSVYVLGDLRSRGISNHPGGVIPIESLESRPLWIWLSLDPNSRNDKDSNFLIAWLPDFRVGRILQSIQ